MNAVIRAIFIRNFAAYFSSPIGYVFICAFVLLSGFAAFWPNAFFNDNLATLDQLNEALPWIMLIFIPAITMSAWAEERRYGTDELVLTLPGADLDVVMGKYLAALAIFTVALLFSLSNLLVLVWLGAPDLGVVLANYAGYWLVGAAMIAIGMVASFMTSSLTVAFILGLAFNAPLVFAAYADAIVPWPGAARTIENLSIAARFDDFGRGLVTLSGVVFFLAVIPASLYLGTVLIGRRHWLGGPGGHTMVIHYSARTLALIGMALGVSMLTARYDVRLDLSQGRINSLSPQTVNLLHNVDAAQPVYVEAFISPTVPEAYVQTRLQLLSALREADALGGDRVIVNIHEAPRFSPEEARAEELFGIRPIPVTSTSGGRLGVEQIVLGAAFTSGLDKVVVPFFERGLPVEYEVVRSIATVSQPARRTVGVVATDAKLFGGFDMATMSNRPAEQIVVELRKQYDVVPVNADVPIGERFDVLLVAQPSSLTPSQLENLTAAIRAGQPTAIFEDPFPYLDPNVPATSQPRLPPRSSPFMQQQPPLPKGDVRPLWDLLGVRFADRQIIWQDYNPYPKIAEIPPEFVFVAAGSGAAQAFNPESEVTSGLQQVLAPFPGAITKAENASTTLAPLLQTGPSSGYVAYDDIMGRTMGSAGINANRRHVPTDGSATLAAHITGPAPSAEEPAPADGGPPAETSPALDVILVADIDMLYSVFFAMRAQGEMEENPVNISVDNVTFVLNALDMLAGDDRFMEIRKRRPAYRTLTAVEREVDAARSQATEERQRFMDDFEKSQAAEQARFEEKIQSLQRREGVDAQQMIIEVATAQQAGQKRLQAMTERLQRERDQKVGAIERDLALRVRNIQNRYKLAAVALPPILPLVLALGVFTYRRKLERVGVPGARLR
jgi:ABC-2 type transport system permease protein